MRSPGSTVGRRAVRESPVGLASYVLLGALVVAACGGPGQPGGSEVGTTPDLAGTSWTVTEIAGTTTLEATTPTLEFGADGGLSGTDGCDRYAFRVSLAGGSIDLGEGETTGIGCEPQVMAQADAFHQALAAATTWRVTPDGALEIGEQGALVAVPTPTEPEPVGTAVPSEDALDDTSWVLIDLGGSADLLGTVVTLELGADGSIGGSGGCNTYRGDFAVDGERISIGPLASTKRACPGPAGRIESTYLSALDAVGLWTVDAAGHLVLTGPTPLTFEPG